MISIFRAFLNTWAAKLFFMLLIGVFLIWGVGDVVTNVGNDTSVAKVGGQRIELQEAGEAYRRQLAQVTRMLGANAEPTLEMRRGVAAQAVERLITQAALSVTVANMGLAVPEDTLRQAVWETAAFAGPDGKFDRNQFQAVLRNNGLTEQRFLDLMRLEIGQRQLMSPVRAGEVAPEVMTRLVFAFQHEKRVADVVDLKLAAAPPPEPPTEDVLHRWYENHPDRFSTPELRRIKAVLLVPERLAAEIEPTEEELQAAYARRRGEFVLPERRSVQVLLVQDEDKAKALAERWTAGADWAAMQAAAREAGAAPVELTDAQSSEIPAPELAAAIFAAAAETVAAPVKSALGWHVLRVTTVTPGSTRAFADVRDELVAAVRADRAADLIYERANKIDDMLAGGTPLEELPGDMGLAAVTGTLDATGKTTEGAPAPIPGGDDLRAAVVQSAFQAAKGDSPRLVEGPRRPGTVSAFYAVEVEDIAPPALRPFEEVEEAVRADWTRDAIRRHQEEAAAKLLAAVKGGQSFADAALVADLPVRRLPPVSRAAVPPPEVPYQLVGPLFELKPGEATMVETADGFVVAALAEVQAANPDAEPIAYGQVRDALARAMGDDAQASVIVGLRTRLRPEVNKTMVDRIVQPE